MAEQTSDSTYRISGLYVTPNWNGNRDRVAMSCGIGAYIKVLRKVSINGEVVVIAADPAGTMARSWSMTAKNTILRTTEKVYLYARVERNGASGMYIWSVNLYDIDGKVPAVDGGEPVTAVNNDQYYYIRVGSLEADRTTCNIDEGQYGIDWGDSEKEDVGYTWSDLIAWDRTNDLLVFLKTIKGLAIEYIILAGHELNKVLTKDDDENEDSNNAVVTAGFLQKWVNKIQGMFLRKDKDDKTEHQLTIGKAVSNDFHSNDFAAGGFDGKGVGMWQVMEDGDPVGYVESDYMTLRRAAYFRSITIAEVNHIGGEVILSQAACQIAFVVPYDASGKPVSAGSPSVSGVAFYRCYFEKKAGGREVYNQWRVGDQARCQRWDANAKQIVGSFYWRVVIATSNGEGAEQVEDYHWIDLSNRSGEYAGGSYEPMPNDNIVLLGHRGGIYDRTCAQVYSTIGSNAPSRRYYEGITSFSLPSPIERMEFERDPDNESNSHAHWRIGDERHYMDYSKNGLDIRTSSMTVIADGGDKEIDVAEVLGDSWGFFTTEDEARKDGDEYAEWMAADELTPNEVDQWDSSVWKNYLNYQIITPYGITYTLDMNGDEVMWHLNTDRHLIHAQETADAAIQNLDDMASDDMITPQEKLKLRDELARLSDDVRSVLDSALSVGVSSHAVFKDVDAWFQVFRAITNYILTSMDDTTKLTNLTVYMASENAIPVVGTMARPDTVVSSTPVGKRHSFQQCYTSVYTRLAIARREINVSIMSSVNDILAGDIDINQDVMNAVKNISNDVAGQKGTITELQGDVGKLINNVVYTDPVSGETWNLLKGMVATENFTTLFAAGADANGKVVTQADITAYVKKDEFGEMVSGVSISADKIDFKAADITIFSNEFRINADNFKVTDDGVYINGEVHATSGTFSGRVSATEGFDMGYTLLNVADHAIEWQIPPGSTISVVRFDYAGSNTVQLPIEPRPGQIIKIFAIEKDGRTNTNLRVTCRSNQKIFFSGKARGDGEGAAYVGESRMAEFVYMDKLALTQNGNWIEPSTSGGVWIYLSEV